MKRFMLIIVMAASAASSGFGYSSDAMRDMTEIRVIAQSVLIYAAEHGDAVSIPYDEIPSVRHSIGTLEGGTISFPPHENFAFPPAEPVPVVFFERIGWVLVGMSNGDVQYFRKSDPPQFWPPPGLASVAWKGFVKIAPWLSLILLLFLLKLLFFPRNRSVDG